MAGRREVDHHDVGRDRRGIGQGRMDGMKAGREPAGVGVILGQSADHIAQRDNARRRDDAALADRAAEKPANRPAALDALPASDDHRADRGPEPFRQAYARRIGMTGDLGRRHAERKPPR